MAAMTSFHTEKCCLPVSAHTASARRIRSSVRQFLIYSTFVFYDNNRTLRTVNGNTLGLLMMSNVHTDPSYCWEVAADSDVNKDLSAKDQDQDQDFSPRTRTRTRT